jgi:predicted DNA-binding transcriptional regulator AlpA
MLDTTVRILTVDEVAGLLGFGPGGALAVRVLDAAGRGPASYPVGGGTVWCRSDVLDWLRDHDAAAELREVTDSLRGLIPAFE